MAFCMVSRSFFTRSSSGFIGLSFCSSFFKNSYYLIT